MDWIAIHTSGLRCRVSDTDARARVAAECGYWLSADEAVAGAWRIVRSR